MRTNFVARGLALVATLALSVTTFAQPMPPGHPPTEGGPNPRALFDAPPLGTSQPTAELPAGTVRIRVVDVEGNGIEGATVMLGTRSQTDDRERVSANTDATGTYTWTGLETGTAQAYRVSVPHEGATFAATPFQLQADRGQDVRIVRVPTTRDDRTLLQLLGQTVVELRDDRIHVVQQAQLANMSQLPQAYVFPEDGMLVPLPEGYLAFQGQPVMTDQKIEEVRGSGFRIRGSLPPGRVTLTWAFDLPMRGLSDLDVVVPVPFRTYIYRVITDAPEGMRLEVDGLPRPQRFQEQGRELFGTEIVRRPGDEPFESFTMHLENVPGPGAARWVALAIAAAICLIGVGFAVAGGSPAAVAARSRTKRRKDLLDEIAALEKMHAAGEIGPQYRQSRREALVRELAVLLHEDEVVGQAGAKQGATKAVRPASG